MYINVVHFDAFMNLIRIPSLYGMYIKTESTYLYSKIVQTNATYENQVQHTLNVNLMSVL